MPGLNPDNVDTTPGNEARQREALPTRDAQCHVFVYGTLRAGESNDIVEVAARLELNAPVLIATTTTRGWLHDFGGYPGLVPDPAGASVVGDIYLVDTAILPALDEIEEVYPDQAGLFARDRLRLEARGRWLECFYYPVDPRQVAGMARIDGGDWVAHRRHQAGNQE
jgi:gamma-glutamylcyclotransferase (GGCT)/AIG2-like uncharacterized protein YtfP